MSIIPDGWWLVGCCRLQDGLIHSRLIWMRNYSNQGAVVSLISLHVSHHALVGQRGGVLLAQRPLQAESAHSRRLDEHRAEFQRKLLVDAAARRRDEARLPQQVIVPAAVPVPNLETDRSAEETYRCVTSSTSWPGKGLIITQRDLNLNSLSCLSWMFRMVPLFHHKYKATASSWLA